MRRAGRDLGDGRLRVLVTGRTGFVGSAIAEGLGARADVVGASRSGELPLDLGDPPAAFAALLRAGPFDAVVHAAASLDRDPAAVRTSIVNVAGTHAVLAAAEAWRAPFVYLSGVTVIGTPRFLPIDEEHPVAPGDPYVASKLAGEHLVRGAARRGLPGAATLRVSAPIGPGMPRGRILGAFVTAATRGAPLEPWGRGTRRQDYVDAADVGAAVSRWLDAGTPAGTFNIASGRAIADLELAHLVTSVLASSSPVRANATKDADNDLHWDVSITRAREAFGYAPTVSLADSIRSIAASWQPREGVVADLSSD